MARMKTISAIETELAKVMASLDKALMLNYNKVLKK